MPSKLVELEIARPGVFGVNTAASGDIMPKGYSVKVDNFIFSDSGYIEARHGSRRTHSAVVTGTVRQIFQTKDESGNDLVLFSTGTKIYRKTAGAPVDITGTITTPTAGNWKFSNLNNVIYATQLGHTMIKLATPSTGTFVDTVLTGTAAPTPTNIVDSMSGFGRIWALADEKLYYSTTLDGEDWKLSTDGGDAGTFNLHATYLSGDERPTAMAEFNGNLLVFTSNSVTVWENPWNPNGLGSSWGGLSITTTDPAMGVLETIGGVGCIARDSIQYTQNDLLYLSEQGVTSLSRVVQEKSMPLKRLSDNVRDGMLGMVRSSDMSTVWSCYLEPKGIYFIGAPDISKCWLIDTSGELPDGTYRALTWSKTIYTMEAQHETSLSASDNSWAAVLLSDEPSYLSNIVGYNDHQPVGGTGGDPYNLTWEGAWSSIIEDFENHLKMPKTLGVVVKGVGTVNFTINLAFDYGDFTDSKARTTFLTLSSPWKYGVAQYGIATYGGAAAIKEERFMGFGSGRIMKIKVTSTVNGNKISLQRVSIKSKIGKQS